MAAKILRPITGAVREYFCWYDCDQGERRKVRAVNAEHAARLFRLSTFHRPNQRHIFVISEEMFEARQEPYRYGLTDYGRYRYLRAAA